MCTNMLGQRRRPEVIDHGELEVTLSPDELLLTLLLHIESTECGEADLT